MTLFGDIGAATRGGFNKLIKARENRVRGQVYAQLLNLDDKALKRAGFERSEIEPLATNFIQL